MFRALIVDDEPGIRKGIKILIDWESCDVELIGDAANGADALEIIKNEKPDIVLTDIKMPDMDGMTLIEESRNLDKVPAFIILSGYSEFSLAKRAMELGVSNFILKPIDPEELVKAIYNIKSRIKINKTREEEFAIVHRREILRKLVCQENSESDYESFEEDLNIKGQSLYCILFEVQDSRNTPENKVLKILADYLRKAFSCGMIPPIITLEKDWFCCLISSSYINTHGNSLNRPLLGLLTEVSEIMDIAVSIGKRVRNVRDFSESYQTARLTSHHSVYRDLNSLIDYRDVQQIKFSCCYEHISSIDTLLTAIKSYDKTAITNCCNDIIDTIRVNYYTLDIILMNISNLIARILDEFREIGQTEPDISSFIRYLTPDNQRIIIVKLAVDLERFALMAAEEYTSVKKNKLKGVVLVVEEYIKDNFEKSLTLKVLGSLFNVNPTYLGQIFKKRTGHAFNDYLQHIRMEKAEILLKETDLLMYEIAGKVGFKDVSYFMTCFEKQYAMSPGHYRKIHSTRAVDIK